MSDTYAHVSSVALEDLQHQLCELAERLMECKSLADTATETVNEKWQDGKFDEFEDEFRPHRKQIEDIASRYEEWAKGYLQERIQKVKDIEELKI